MKRYAVIFEESSRLWSKEQQRKGVALIAAYHRKNVEIEQLFKEQALLVSDPTITDARAFNERFGRLNELALQKQKESDAQYDEGKRLMTAQ